jgi:hypothetical protein
MTKISVLLLSIFFFLSFLALPVKGIVNPLDSQNNKFGIHILNDSDLEDAANLVNSSGGDYGYVTTVIREDERDTKRWQKFMDKARELHLIPIIRIASKTYDHSWQALSVDEIPGWVDFLNSLNWVTENRYLIVGNEPNHASEWGGSVDPKAYAAYLEIFSNKLKEKSQDFFVLPAGLDASAPNSKNTMSEDSFISQMLNYDKGIFNYIDGWASHSYPNPGFSGSQDDKGKGTVTSFEWELGLLKSLGISKDLPIFITETGWQHDKDLSENNLKDTASKLVSSYQIAWNRNNIIAVTPFVLNYQDAPFDVFSWKSPEGNFYDIYNEVKNLPKIKGEPKIIESLKITALIIPPIIPGGGKLTGIVQIKNTGQRIWNGNETIYTKTRGIDSEITPLVLWSPIKPGTRALAIMRLIIKKK